MVDAPSSPPLPSTSRSSTPARSWWSTLCYSAALCSVAVVISGTRACQEDYVLGAQTRGLDPTPIPGETGTPRPTETPSTALTATPTALGTVTAVASLTPVATGSVPPTPTAPATSTPEVEPLSIRSVLRDTSASRDASERSGGSADSQGRGAATNPNWLGEAFVARVGADTDGDGFTDDVEKEHQSDAKDPNKVPGHSCASLLRDRLAGMDDDADGLLNSDEQRLGTNPVEADSDGDGCNDGAEMWSQSKPMDAKSIPQSEGGFCLSDEFKKSKGLTLGSDDNDNDGLADWLEMAIGSDTKSADSDGDGIYDGKEVQLGCDPLRKDYLG